MEKKTCPICGEEISTLVNKCPYCNEWINVTTVDGGKPTNDNAASMAYAGVGAEVNGVKYSKVLVSFMVFLSLMGNLLSFTQYGMPNDRFLRELTGGMLPVIGDIMDGIGICVLFCMFGMKISSEGIKGISKGLVMTIGIMAVVVGLYDDDSLIATIVALVFIVCWIIVGIQALKVERLRKIGIWMILADILQIVVLVIINNTNHGGKAMFKVSCLLFLLGYVYLYKNLKEYLCTAMRKE